MPARNNKSKIPTHPPTPPLPQHSPLSPPYPSTLYCPSHPHAAPTRTVLAPLLAQLCDGVTLFLVYLLFLPTPPPTPPCLSVWHFALSLIFPVPPPLTSRRRRGKQHNLLFSHPQRPPPNFLPPPVPFSLFSLLLYLVQEIRFAHTHTHAPAHAHTKKKLFGWVFSFLYFRGGGFSPFHPSLCYAPPLSRFLELLPLRLLSQKNNPSCPLRCPLPSTTPKKGGGGVVEGGKPPTTRIQ